MVMLGVSSCRGSIVGLAVLFDVHEAVIDGGESISDLIELQVEIGDEFLEQSLEVDVVSVGTHCSGVGSNWSSDTRCNKHDGGGCWQWLWRWRLGLGGWRGGDDVGRGREEVTVTEREGIVDLCSKQLRVLILINWISLS